jgi:hypothetical protein
MERAAYLESALASSVTACTQRRPGAVVAVLSACAVGLSMLMLGLNRASFEGLG